MRSGEKAVVLGGGFAGCTAADLLRRAGFSVTLIEGGSNLGGGCWTQWYGGHPHTFGPRVFFSRDQEVIDQLERHIDIRQFDTKSFTYVERDGQMYHYPLQAGDLPSMPDHERIVEELAACQGQTPDVTDFESYWTSAIGPTLYDKFVDRYSKKMWGVESNRQLSANWEWVNRGTPIREGDTRLYEDQYQGYPSAPDGYNGYFVSATGGIDVHLNCPVTGYDPATRTVETKAGPFVADVLVNTIHVDALFGFVHGRLQWCGRQFLPVWLPVEQAMPDDVTWIHYSGDEAFTRVTEFKKITGHVSPSTLLGVEIPAPVGRYYPVQSAPELARFDAYRQLFPDDFLSIGRLGTFKYKGIPDAIRDALDAVATVT
jgi:UDP-galactopyranose mutase